MWAYLTPALLLFLEVGFPFGLLVPGGDTLLLFLGALAGEGKLALFPLLPLLFLGAFLGHGVGYGVGRWLGPPIRRRFSPELVRKGEGLLARFGPFALLLAPFVPGLRTLVPLLFGALGFPLLPLPLAFGLRKPPLDPGPRPLRLEAVVKVLHGQLRGPGQSLHQQS
jgi:membrane-associated protein